MNRTEMQKFLSAQFATWLATARGRDKPDKNDKRAGEVVADQTVDSLEYYGSRT